MSGTSLPLFGAPKPGRLVLVQPRTAELGPLRHTLGPAGASIGSGPEADVQLQDDALPIQPRHGQITASTAGYQISAGAPGLLLNGAEVPPAPAPPLPIQPGDRIRLGRHELAVESNRADFTLGTLFPDATPGLRPDIPKRDSLAEMLDDWQLDAQPAPAALPASDPQAGRTAAQPAGTDALADIVSRLQQTTPIRPVEPPAEDALPLAPSAAEPRFPAVSLESSAAPPSGLDPLPPPPGLAPNGVNPQQADGGRQVAIRLLSGSEDATSALAAFWWSLGVLPPGKGSGELFQLMSELGRAFRELTTGMAALAGARSSVGGQADSNPLNSGMAGLQHLLEESRPGQVSIAAHVRDFFEAMALRDKATADLISEAAHTLVESLGARAVETRVSPMVRTGWRRSYNAECWRLFRIMSADIGNMAELRFHQDVDDRLRGAQRRATTPAATRAREKQAPAR